MTPAESAEWCAKAEEKGLKLMADMGASIVSGMSSPSMPSDLSIKSTLSNVAKTTDDYTEKAASAVQDMANKLLDGVKGAIQSAISKTPPEMPTPAAVTAAIKSTIESAG